MIRRRFLGLIAGAGAGVTGVTALTKASIASGPRETVTYLVTGFTCITCATGLETILGREKGVLAVKATYPEGLTTVDYNPRLIRDEAVQSTIESMGFKARQISTKES